MKRILIFILTVLVFSNAVFAGETLTWGELPDLPPAAGGTYQPGLAGVFAGIHDDVLILAGGANFPDGLPWRNLADGSNPKKTYHSDIYFLRKGETWKVADIELPHGLAYGVSITTDQGLICLGGEWQEYDGDSVSKHWSTEVFLIRHQDQGKLVFDKTGLPRLPEAVSCMAGTRLGNFVYLAGGNNGQRETKHFWRLNLLDSEKWEILEPWPGPPRSFHIAETQSDGQKDCLYLFSGRFKDLNNKWQILRDSYKYDPQAGSWTKLADVGTNQIQKQSVCVMAAPGIRMGANHIAIFGGASGDLFLKVEQELHRQIIALERAGESKKARTLDAERWNLYENHPGFSRDILVYHTITDTWSKMGEVPETIVDGGIAGSHVTTPAVRWGKDIVIPGGEVRPGVRSPQIRVVTPEIQVGFGMINYCVLGAYLGILIILGFYFSKREKNTDDFFKAGGRVPWWAAGLSIFGTQLSAITFMAIPAKSFSTDWTWLTMNMTIVVVAPLIVFLFLPFYRRLNVTTAYEYIEKRFNVVVRLTASFMFMLFQLARIGIVLYLPSIALSVVTGIDIRMCITVMALLSIAYTVLGGIEAVIWTDVIQVFVLLGGAILVLFSIPNQIPGGFSGVIDLAAESEKFRLFDIHFSLKSPTLWVLLLGGMGANLISYGSDQTVIQRYLTTSNEKEAARGIWTNAILTVPASLIFFGLGTVLFVFYKTHPQSLGATLERSDALFPWFIVTQLPAGIAGLLIAGIFAAAMSSLDSSMNSVSAAFTTDFYRRFKSENNDDGHCLAVARIVTVVIGLTGMAFAMAMATWDIESLWGEFTKYIGLFGGGLGGLFLLAILTRCANSRGVMIGLAASAVLQYFLNVRNMVHGILFAATGLISCFVIGYLSSLLLPGDKKNLTGLTIHSFYLSGKN